MQNPKATGGLILAPEIQVPSCSAPATWDLHLDTIFRDLNGCLVAANTVSHPKLFSNVGVKITRSFGKFLQVMGAQGFGHWLLPFILEGMVFPMASQSESLKGPLGACEFRP